MRSIARARTGATERIWILSIILSSETGIVFAVRRVEIDYLLPARLDDALRFELEVKAAGKASLTFAQRIVCLPETLLSRAMVKIAGQEHESPVEPGSEGVIFELELPAGKTELRTFLFDEKGKAGGAYFTEVEAL